jgi:hypothetical protein
MQATSQPWQPHYTLQLPSKPSLTPTCSTGASTSTRSNGSVAATTAGAPEHNATSAAGKGAAGCCGGQSEPMQAGVTYDSTAGLREALAQQLLLEHKELGISGIRLNRDGTQLELRLSSDALQRVEKPARGGGAACANGANGSSPPALPAATTTNAAATVPASASQLDVEVPPVRRHVADTPVNHAC